MLLHLLQRRRRTAAERVEIVEEMFDEAGPEVTFDVMPCVEVDLDDVLVERMLALHQGRFAGGV
jgi:hypothetical protein